MRTKLFLLSLIAALGVHAQTIRGPVTTSQFSREAFTNATAAGWKSKLGIGVGTNGGTVTSVGLTVPDPFTVSSTPVTDAGTIAIALPGQDEHTVFAGPQSGSGAPSFRILDDSDIPSLDATKITSGILTSPRLGAGTANANTFLRGDGFWAAISGGGAFIGSTNGAGTNTTMDGRTLFTGHFIGLNDSNFFLGTPISGMAGIGNPFGQVQFQVGENFGALFLDHLRSPLLYLGGQSSGTTEGWLRGVWHNNPIGNLIPQSGSDRMEAFRNTEAAIDAYFNAIGGSASALADMPARGPEIWANQRKPFVVLSTRGSAAADFTVSCSQSNMVQGVTAFRTNGYTTVISNLGIGMAYIMENGWLTNHRSPNGLLKWNTDNFPWLTNNPTMPTNLTHYLSTNGFETWLLMYAHTRVPSVTNWPASTWSELDVNLVGSAFWEYPNGNAGASPFGGGFHQPAMTFDSIHRDVSTMYMWGVRGLFVQDVSGVSGSGYFDQLVRTFGYSSLNPYYQPGQSTEIKLDAQWNRWYPGNHGMILGFFMGSAGASWAVTHANDANALYTESNDTTVPPTGSGGLGWLMGQIRYESQFLTNAHGRCHFTPGTDGAAFDDYDYTDWQSHLGGLAMFKANIWLTGDDTPYHYFTNAAFGTLLTNRSFLSAWQDVTDEPTTVLSISASNAIFMRKLSDGTPLVWFINEDGNNSTNLTINWSQFGWPSNTLVAATELWTNTFLGPFTNTITMTVPAKGSQLLKLYPALRTDSSNTFQIARTTNSTEFRGNNNKLIAKIWNSGGTFAVGDTTAGFNVNAAVVARAPTGADGRSLSLQDSTDIAYALVRDGPTGNLRIIGDEVKASTGLDIESTESATPTKIFRISGGAGIMAPTNALANWPTEALTRGGYAIVNSNATVYILTSTPNSTAWGATNKLAP